MAVITSEAQALDDGPTSDEADISAFPVEARSISVNADGHGKRLDVVLAQQVPEFSRSYLQQLIHAGAVELQGKATFKASQRVMVGDTVVLEMRPTEQSQSFRPEQIALNIVYQDEHLLVVDKPAGLVVHPAPGNWSGTLLNALLGRDSAAAFVPRAGIVHRLDKDTSGLMVVARTRACMDQLVALIAERQVNRQYLAIAGRPWQGALERTVEAPIGRDPRTRLKMAVVDTDRHPGKTARTDFLLLNNAPDGCLVQCTLHTGRTHQIRVHMAHIGLALVADSLYGGRQALGLSRQALHAWKLAFRHPMTGEPMAFQVPLAPDMVLAVEAAGFLPP